MQRILLVKTSSLGDVVHNLPVVTDLRSAFPGAEIDWVVEEVFAPIPPLHPGVREAIPVAVRRWRKAWRASATRREIAALKTRLRARAYDFIIDTQGLAKSALLARLAQGVRCGYDWKSAREPLASLLYDRGFRVERGLHAVERNRRLAAQAAGYRVEAPPDYGIAAPGLTLPWAPGMDYAVLLHATSRAQKLWPEASWTELGRRLKQAGLASVLPWGTPSERLRSERLAAAIPGARVPPALALADLAALLARARVVVGVDTGLLHLAAALGVAAVGIYCASNPELTGIYGAARGINLGKAGAPPATREAVNAVLKLVPELQASHG